MEFHAGPETNIIIIRVSEGRVERGTTYQKCHQDVTCVCVCANVKQKICVHTHTHTNSNTSSGQDAPGRHTHTSTSVTLSTTICKCVCVYVLPGNDGGGADVKYTRRVFVCISDGVGPCRDRRAGGRPRDRGDRLTLLLYAVTLVRSAESNPFRFACDKFR